MKRGYKRLLLFEILIFILLILSNFAPSILTGYKSVIIYFTLLLIFRLFFGFEKDRHRYWKIICVELIINLLVFYIFYYLLGIIVGFVKNLYTVNIIFLFSIIIPIVLTIIIQELLRYLMITKSEESKLLTITTIILFSCMYLIGSVNSDIFTTSHNMFIFVATILLPTLSRNIFASYLSYKSGYKPVILYMLCITLYRYLLPIAPNPNQYLYSIIELLAPMFFMYNMYRFYKKDQDEDVIRDYQKNRILPLILPIMLASFLVYIVSGYFKYQAIVIASGSMTPHILKGDMVIIEKNHDYKNLKVGQILAYKHGNTIIVHRIVKRIKLEGHYYFYTKGDNNDSVDNYDIDEKDVIGTVDIRIPYIGYPTVWLNNL